MHIKLRLNEGMQFVGTPESGHSVLLDSVEDVGGFDSAPHPVEMVLIGLGGCTGMDVVSLLSKMREDFEAFEILIDAERATEHPKVIQETNLKYRVWGDVSEDNFQKAIDLSLDKYCSVANTLKPNVNIEYEYEINPDREQQNQPE